MDTYVEVPGGRLFAVVDGEGPPVVLLHAAIVDLRAWDDMVPGLVRAGFRAIRYDRRGFGRSTTEDVSYGDHTDLVSVLDALEVRQAALVGNSMGGVVAIDTAIEFPDRVVAVMGVGTGLSGFVATVKPEEMAAYQEEERLAEAADASGTATEINAIAEFEVRLWLDGLGQPPDRVPSDVRDRVRAMCRAIHTPGRVRGHSVPMQPLADDRLGELRCPVLTIVGGLDVSEVPSTAHRIVEGAPDASIVVLPNVAHLVGMEVPETLAEVVREFLAPLGAWA
jgi:3-oxoadipate enol-lactonase